MREDPEGLPAWGCCREALTSTYFSPAAACYYGDSPGLPAGLPRPGRKVRKAAAKREELPEPALPARAAPLTLKDILHMSDAPPPAGSRSLSAPARRRGAAPRAPAAADRQGGARARAGATRLARALAPCLLVLTRLTPRAHSPAQISSCTPGALHTQVTLLRWLPCTEFSRLHIQDSFHTDAMLRRQLPRRVLHTPRLGHPPHQGHVCTQYALHSDILHHTHTHTLYTPCA